MPFPRRVRRLAGAATAVTAGVVMTGVLTGGGTAPASGPEVDRASLGSVTLPDVAELRTQRLSRTAPRVALEPRPVAHRFAAVDALLRDAAGSKAAKVGVLKKGMRVAVTGQVVGSWAEVLVSEEPRWVVADQLAATKPRPKPRPKPEPKPEPQAQTQDQTQDQSQAPAEPALSGAPCAAGSSIESGLTSAATRVYRAVCAAFPQPRSYGGYDPHGEHVDGRAIDIMVSGQLGQQIADWLRANAGALGIRNIIFAQRIWSSERGGEGWRGMSDRGSATANHYDHVHVAVH